MRSRTRGARIRVQAYGFTSRPILRALAAARARGIDVQVILDKSDAPALDRDDDPAPPRRTRRRWRFAGAESMADAGVPVWIDDLPAIAHNKLILIDGHLVIGGSYNYTAAAERRNAENVTFIDSTEVAQWFLANWRSRRELSRPWAPHPGAVGEAGKWGGFAAGAGCAPECAHSAAGAPIKSW